MKNAKGNIKEKNKLFLASGRFAIALVCLYVFLFWELCKSIDISLIFVIVLMILSLLLIFFLMPIVYEKINSSVLVSTGRYHITLSIVILLAPLSTIMLFTLGQDDSLMLKISVMILAYITSIMSILTQFYVSNSMRKRIILERDKSYLLYRSVARLVGGVVFFVACFVSTIFGFGIEFVSFVSGTIALIGGVCSYFGTVEYIPLFIRIESPKARPLKSIFSRFYGVIDKKRNKFMVLSYFFIATSIVMFIIMIPSIATIFSVSAIIVLAGSVLFMIAYFLFEHICELKLNQFNIYKITIAISSTCVVGYISILLRAILFDYGVVVDSVVVITIMAMVGTLSGISSAVVKYQRQDMIVNSLSTEGIVNLIYNMILIASFTIAIVVACIVTLINIFAMAIFYGVIIALLITSFVMVGLWKKNSGVPLNDVDMMLTKELLSGDSSQIDEDFASILDNAEFDSVTMNIDGVEEK